MQETGGRVRLGLVQSFAVWLVAFGAMWFTRNAAVAWALFGTGLITVLLLGNVHRRRHRPDSAVGAYTGAVLWPLLLGATLIAVTAVTASLSPYE